jgi:hypothetical protein
MNGGGGRCARNSKRRIEKLRPELERYVTLLLAKLLLMKRRKDGRANILDKSQLTLAISKSGWLAGLIFAVSAVGTICVLWRLLIFSHYGLDFTDESYYIVSIADPFSYDETTTQFGFVYHPLYLFTNGDIPTLRQLNVLLTFALAWTLVNTFLSQMAALSEMRRIERFVISAAIATASLILFDDGITTPSYNSLALNALLISAIGLLLAKQSATPTSVLGWLLIGVGGWLAFMAKPTTALALAFVSLSYLLASRKVNVRLILLSAGISALLLVVSALALDGSVILFLKRLKNGMELGYLLESRHTFGALLRLDNFHLSGYAGTAIAAIAALTVLSFHLAMSRNFFLKLLSSLVLASMLGVTVFLSAGLSLDALRLGVFQGMLIWGVVIAAFGLGLTVCRTSLFGQVSAAQWALAGAFLALPHALAFGTNDNYWANGSSGGLFWLIGGLIFAAPAARRQDNHVVFLPIALATQMVTAILLQSGFVMPYRQPQPLQLNDQSFAFGGGQSILVLSAGYASYLSDAVAAANKAGLDAGTPVIDMSGQSPGIVYALQSQNLGQAWMIGGYKGSLERAVESLKRVSCGQLADAWLLTEPAGKRRIPSGLLATFGADLHSDYKQVGTWITAAGAGGYGEQRAQELMKPTRQRDSAVAACNASKGRPGS